MIWIAARLIPRTAKRLLNVYWLAGIRLMSDANVGVAWIIRPITVKEYIYPSCMVP